jgi:hypothetical protein
MAFCYNAFIWATMAILVWLLSDNMWSPAEDFQASKLMLQPTPETQTSWTAERLKVAILRLQCPTNGLVNLDRLRGFVGSFNVDWNGALKEIENDDMVIQRPEIVDAVRQGARGKPDPASYVKTGWKTASGREL